MKSKLKVSVIVITYNQERYIKDALESIVSQERDFDLEVIIGDDCSTDKTRDIIKDYVSKYPDVITPLFRKKNMGAWQNFVDGIKQAEGQYIALCEGDDYWTDSRKLQKQVDFLDKNQDYSICFHKAKVVYEDSKEETIYPDVDNLSWYNFKELLSINYIPTASVMYRKQNYSQLEPEMMPGDWYLHVFHAQFGKIHIIDEVMSVYRKHMAGIWWDYDKNRDQIWRKHGLSYIRLYSSFIDIVKQQPKEYADIVRTSLFDTILTIARVDRKFGDSNLEKVQKDFPEYILPFMEYVSYQYDHKTEENNNYKNELLRVGDEKHEISIDLAREKEIHEGTTKELLAIKKTKLWKTRNKVTVLYKKIKK